MTSGSHPREALQDLLDGRIAPEGLRQVETHLAACEACRRELEALRATREALGRGLPDAPVPPLDLGALLDREDSARLPKPTERRAWVLAAAAVLLVATVWATRGVLDSDTDLATLAADDFRALAASRLPITHRTGDPPVLERHFAAEGISFPTHVYDLAMMDFSLEGGRVHDFAGQASALFAYRTPTGKWLVCQMYRGDVDELPPDAATHEERGFRFHTFRRSSVTVVFWQEGPIVCALASDLPAEQVVGLAAAKAMRA